MLGTTEPHSPAPPRRSWPRFALGLLLAAAVTLSAAEAYLRLFPPPDIHPFLGDESPLSGPFEPDPEWILRFRSWAELCQQNPKSLGRRAAPPGTTWLFLGNSFAFEYATWRRKQGPGPVTPMNLDHREPLVVRLAQIRMLLENGYHPERLFLVLTPVDFKELGEEPLAYHAVNDKGGRVFRPRLPPEPLGWLVRHSRVAFTAWARSGRHHGNPGFERRQFSRRVPDSVRQDLERLFQTLARECRRHEVPVTVLLIPMRREVAARRGFALEDTLVALLEQAGLEVIDPRGAFLAYPEPAALYVPDGHLSDRGNQLVHDAILQHLHANIASTRRNREASPP